MVTIDNNILKIELSISDVREAIKNLEENYCVNINGELSDKECLSVLANIMNNEKSTTRKPFVVDLHNIIIYNIRALFGDRVSIDNQYPYVPAMSAFTDKLLSMVGLD